MPARKPPPESARPIIILEAPLRYSWFVPQSARQQRIRTSLLPHCLILRQGAKPQKFLHCDVHQRKTYQEVQLHPVVPRKYRTSNMCRFYHREIAALRTGFTDVAFHSRFRALFRDRSRLPAGAAKPTPPKVSGYSERSPFRRSRPASGLPPAPPRKTISLSVLERTNPFETTLAVEGEGAWSSSPCRRRRRRRVRCRRSLRARHGRGRCGPGRRWRARGTRSRGSRSRS